MTYRERLNSWAIVRLLPEMQQEVVARFRRCSDANGHLRLLERQTPGGKFLVVFDGTAIDSMN